MATIFSKIIAGEIPAHKIAENEEFIAFLDIRPISEGHTLVVPKKETDYIFDIDDRTLGLMIIFAKEVAAAIKTVIDCKRIGLTVIGLEVPHAHIHLIPIKVEADMCNKDRRPAPDEALASLALKLREAFEAT